MVSLWQTVMQSYFKIPFVNGRVTAETRIYKSNNCGRGILLVQKKVPGINKINYFVLAYYHQYIVAVDVARQEFIKTEMLGEILSCADSSNNKTKLSSNKITLITIINLTRL